MRGTMLACIVESMTIGDRIRGGRESLDINQSELARRLGVTPQAVQQWEAGINVPRRRYIKPLADLLGMSQFYLELGDQPTKLIYAGEDKANYSSGDITLEAISDPEMRRIATRLIRLIIDGKVQRPKLDAVLRLLV